MASINLKHTSGNGTILNSPASNPSSDITLKLPSTTGSAGQVLKVASANHSSTNAELEFGSEGASGKILQVIQTVKKDRTTIQSTTLVDIAGMSVTITPSSSSNKVLINYSLSLFTNNQYYVLRLLRGSDSTIFIGDQNPSATSQSRGSFGSLTASYVDATIIAQSFLDSPNTTSATTYKLQAHSPYSSSYIIGINSSPTLDNYTYLTNCVSTITAMEVAA